MPNAGKSSLFSALTGVAAEAANYPFTTIEPNIAVVPVADPRLDAVAQTVRASKVVPDTIAFHDIAGLVAGAHRGEGLGNQYQFLVNIRETDAIVHMVRVHEDPNVVHPEGRVDPLADIETIETELIYADLEQAERRLERVARGRLHDPGDAHAHDDHRPSCSVNLESGAFHCWGCGAKGGAYDAAVEILKLSLDERLIEELKTRVCRRLGIALALIYGRPARARARAVTDLGTYLARKRDPPPRGDPEEPWPGVPRSHPLRFRYDCWRAPEPEQFARVERRLFGCMTLLGGWCRSAEPSRLLEIERALRVVIAADDPELAYVRRCGAELVLITGQIPMPLAAPLSLRPHAVTAREIDAVHGYTNPAIGGYQLAKLITNLPDELLALIGRDQITGDAILGCPVPEVARPILRAIENRREPVLDIPGRVPGEPGEDAADQHIAMMEPRAVEQDFATALGSLLRGRSVRLPSRELSRRVRSRLEALRADGILDRRYRGYRASHIALRFSIIATERSNGWTSTVVGIRVVYQLYRCERAGAWRFAPMLPASRLDGCAECAGSMRLVLTLRDCCRIRPL